MRNLGSPDLLERPWWSVLFACESGDHLSPHSEGGNESHHLPLKGNHVSEDTLDRSELLALTSEIVSAHVANNAVSQDGLPELISNVFGTLEGLIEPAAPEPEPLVPAVSIRKSVQDEYLVCLEDGKKLKMLKRHLSTSFDMTPADYRAKWGLPSDYPMVAPAYARKRQELAKKIGLGRKPAVKPAPRRRAAAKKK